MGRHSPIVERGDMFGRWFWLEALERALKTAAQSALAVYTVGATGLVVDAAMVDWRTVGLVAAGSAGASLLSSIASAPLGPDDSPSLV